MTSGSSVALHGTLSSARMARISRTKSTSQSISDLAALSTSVSNTVIPWRSVPANRSSSDATDTKAKSAKADEEAAEIELEELQQTEVGPGEYVIGFVMPAEYPDVPGHRGVETSVEAAQAIAPKIGGCHDSSHSGVT